MPEKQTKLFRLGVRLKSDEAPTEYLVRAHTLGQAENHITKDIVQGEVASQEDIYRLAQSGVKVIDITTPPAAAELPSGSKPPAAGKK